MSSRVNCKLAKITPGLKIYELSLYSFPFLSSTRSDTLQPQYFAAPGHFVLTSVPVYTDTYFMVQSLLCYVQLHPPIPDLHIVISTFLSRVRLWRSSLSYSLCCTPSKTTMPTASDTICCI